MNWSEDRLVRPTFRCLIEDLAADVGPAELRAALASVDSDMKGDPHYLLPVLLPTAEHIVLDKANMLARNPAAARERIQAITDRVAVKVKAADRRGALWQDPGGVWWFIAAGHRRDDGPGDFYREIARHGGDSERIRPTHRDRRYLSFEPAYAAERQAEGQAQADIVGKLLEAAANPGSPRSVEVFGATITVTVDPEDDGSDTLSLSFDFSTFEHQDRFPVDIIGFVPGRESIDDWDILPPLRVGDPECWYTYVSEAWVEWLASAVEADQLVEDPWQAPSPPGTREDQLSHRAVASVITMA